MVPICDPTYPLNPPKLVNWPKIGSTLATFFAGYLLLPIQFPDFLAVWDSICVDTRRFQVTQKSNFSNSQIRGEESKRLEVYCGKDAFAYPHSVGKSCKILTFLSVK